MKHALYWLVLAILTARNPTVGSRSLAELSRTFSVSLPPETNSTQPGSVSVVPVVSARRTFTVAPTLNTSIDGSSATRVAGALGAVAASPHAATDAATATRPAATRRRPDRAERVERSIGISS